MGLPLEDRLLLVDTNWRTDLTPRQFTPIFGVSKSAANRNVDHLGPLLALRPRRRFRRDVVLIVDATPVPPSTTRWPNQSKAYRCSTNHQVVIEADTRLVVAQGRFFA